jgi:nucleotide-binding universal stress UspA family protein
MKRFKKILMVLSLQEDDEALLRWAGLIASYGATEAIHCVHSWVPLGIPEELKARYPWLLEPGEQLMHERLAASVARYLRAPSGVTLSTKIQQGNPLGDALQIADEGDFDLIIVARQIEGAALAEKLARKAPCSVLAVPTGTPVRCQRILGAVDFSDYCRLAVDSAAALARASGATLTLFHAYRLAWGHHRAMIASEQMATDMRTHYLSQLAKLSVELAGSGLDVGTLVASAPLPASSIAQQVTAGSYDLVVIGCRGHHAIYATLLGSTAESILHECPCAVLAVKAKGTGSSLLQQLRLSR